MDNINPTNMHHEYMVVTPELAKKWLSTNDRNRMPTKRELKKVEYDLIHGEFHLTHQAIAIDPNGILFDGQHRLMAIVNTGIAAPLTVAFNAPRNTKIDIGTRRTCKQSMYMAGAVEKGSIEYDTLTYPLIKFMVFQAINEERSVIMTADNFHSMYLRFKPIIDPVVEIVRKASGRCRSAAILYAMVCAYNSGVSKETLEKWHKIVETGDFYVPDNDYLTKVGRGVLSFRKYINEDSSSRGATVADKERTMKKAMSSIRNYATNRIVSFVRGENAYEKVVVTEDDLIYKEE